MSLVNKGMHVNKELEYRHIIYYYYVEAIIAEVLTLTLYGKLLWKNTVGKLNTRARKNG